MPGSCIGRGRACNRIGHVCGVGCRDCSAQGLRLRIDDEFLQRLNAARLWDGSAVPEGLAQRLRRVRVQLDVVHTQLKEVEAARRSQAPQALIVGPDQEQKTTGER